ncbi:MAG: hypothetical protein EZS28_003997 [Streblomastix strix]|uniref:Uncharacterized protein n=1 Tax=Streblomastix strix TaxID=222440 RepID=A0A5J4WZW4_9EUKA|nr:MAG: hypothetical protein EZS28_003997 [Streblomastix strix]
MMSISYCTAGGVGEKQDQEILNGLIHINHFLRKLHKGRNYYQPCFQSLPLLARSTEEQIEEEGANEELEDQMNNNGQTDDFMTWANRAKAETLNHFIHNN